MRRDRRAPSFDRTPRALALAGCVAFAALLPGCGGDAPRVRVVNASGVPLDGAWIVGQSDSVRVPALAPGDSADVRARVDDEDMILVRGTASGRAIVAWGPAYAGATGAYRFRAVVDSSLEARIVTVSGPDR